MKARRLGKGAVEKLLHKPLRVLVYFMEHEQRQVRIFAEGGDIMVLSPPRSFLSGHFTGEDGVDPAKKHLHRFGNTISKSFSLLR